MASSFFILQNNIRRTLKTETYGLQLSTNHLYLKLPILLFVFSILSNTVLLRQSLLREQGLEWQLTSVLLSFGFDVISVLDSSSNSVPTKA